MLIFLNLREFGLTERLVSFLLYFCGDDGWVGKKEGAKYSTSYALMVLHTNLGRVQKLFYRNVNWTVSPFCLTKTIFKKNKVCVHNVYNRLPIRTEFIVTLSLYLSLYLSHSPFFYDSLYDVLSRLSRTVIVFFA